MAVLQLVSTGLITTFLNSVNILDNLYPHSSSGPHSIFKFLLSSLEDHLRGPLFEHLASIFQEVPIHSKTLPYSITKLLNSLPILNPENLLAKLKRAS